MGDVNLEIKLKNLEEKVENLEVGAVEVDGVTITRNVADELQIDETVMNLIGLAVEGVQDNATDINTINDKLRDNVDFLKSKNLADIEQGGISETGLNQNDSDSLKYRCRTKNFIPVSSGEKIAISAISGTVARINYYTSNSESAQSTSATSWLSLPYTLTVPGETSYIKVSFRPDPDGVIDGTTRQIQIERGNVVTPYKPYNKSNVQIAEDLREVIKTVSVTLPNSGTLASQQQKDYIDYDVSDSIPNGYRLLSVIGSASGDRRFIIYACRVSGEKTIDLRITNMGSTANSGAPQVILICVKQ